MTIWWFKASTRRCYFTYGVAKAGLEYYTFSRYGPGTPWKEWDKIGSVGTHSIDKIHKSFRPLDVTCTCT